MEPTRLQVVLSAGHLAQADPKVVLQSWESCDPSGGQCGSTFGHFLRPQQELGVPQKTEASFSILCQSEESFWSWGSCAGGREFWQGGQREGSQVAHR